MTVSKKKLIYSCQAAGKGKGLKVREAKPETAKRKGQAKRASESKPRSQHCSQFAVAMA